MAVKKKVVDEEEEVLTKEDYQIDQVKKTYVLLDKYWETIEDGLAKNYKTLIKFIATYRNKNISKLETPYPVDYPPWVPACNKIIYTCCDVDEKDFVADVKTIRGWEGYEDPYLADKAPYILLMLVARWMIMHDYNKELAIVEHFIGYAHYWAVFTVQFKRYKPKLEVMKYTIAEMSYKSRLKALGSVDKWLYDGVSNTLTTYKDRIMRASDFELHYVNEKIRGKFKSSMKTLYRAQEKNEKEKNYIFTSKSIIDQSDEIQTNTGGVAEILSLADVYASKFFSEPINEKALKGSLIPNGMSERDLRNVILMISDNKENTGDLKRLYQAFFHLFLDSGKYKPRDIGSLRFYYEMEKLYKPGNSNDPNKNAIKEILDSWLEKGNPTFRTTNRTATITTFRKTIYEYFVLKIMQDK